MDEHKLAEQREVLKKCKDNNRFEDLLEKIFEYKPKLRIAHLTAKTYAELTKCDLETAKKTLKERGTPLEYEGWYEIEF